jgi:DNA-binding CsgD family transcriptional regulator
MLGLPRGVEERWRARRRERAQAMQKRRAQMLKLRAAGATPQQIADRFNLTSRHVQQILKAPSP